MLWRRKLFVPSVALALVLSAPAGAATASTPTDTSAVATPITTATADFAAPGPYATAVEVGAITTLYYPRDIANSDRRHPVIVWGNGTNGIPLVYRDLLLHWASQGFVVAVANTPQSNLGISMRAGIDMLTRRDADPDSVFRDRVDLEHIGASGHSQGGAAAIVVGAHPRIDTVLPIQPGPPADIDAVRVPALLLAGRTASSSPSSSRPSTTPPTTYRPSTASCAGPTTSRSSATPARSPHRPPRGSEPTSWATGRPVPSSSAPAAASAPTPPPGPTSAGTAWP
ncbi:hypothetical protein ACFWVP_03035 [Streptomyces sp. NPDC058637]|uniref:poly(ethylene terephthalate) hydrolase family protein n=1 Tax=Streptomyces sp. NPDC058637 TaxID=3346569 RepID=UPI003650BA37